MKNKLGYRYYGTDKLVEDLEDWHIDLLLKYEKIYPIQEGTLPPLYGTLQEAREDTIKLTLERDALVDKNIEYMAKVREAIESIQGDMSYASSIPALDKLKDMIGIRK